MKQQKEFLGLLSLKQKKDKPKILIIGISYKKNIDDIRESQL